MTQHYRIAVGLSGGVDSAVAALLLKRAGHEVVGIFMKNWEDDDDGQYCSSRQDFLDAAAVADVLGIEIEHINFAAEYKQRVFAEFLREYQAGRTPNPDILCNSEIKFRAFLDYAVTHGADKIATGHYARRRDLPESGVELLKGTDENKDQSYFLCRLSQAQLAPVVFPVGELHKPQVRKIARDAGLPNAKKKDSTGICFIGERPFREFLGHYLPTRPGEILDDRGRHLGQHIGLAFYTLGQRRGLGIGGRKENHGESLPWFVARKDLQNNRLFVVEGHDHPWLLSRSLIFGQVNWIGMPPVTPLKCAAKTRYRQRDAACTLMRQDNDLWRLDFDKPQWAVTPGQSAVIYNGDVCLGGGIIERAEFS